MVAHFRVFVKTPRFSLGTKALHRTISAREAARIQGFFDDHVFCGPPSTQPLQVANAVPPQLAEVVGRAVLASREGAR